jgi:hypothetical protein
MPNPANLTSTNVTSAVTIQPAKKKRPATRELSKQREYNRDGLGSPDIQMNFAAEVEVESHEEPIQIKSLMSFLQTGQQSLNSDIPTLTRPNKIFYKYGERFVMKHPPQLMARRTSTALQDEAAEKK